MQETDTRLKIEYLPTDEIKEYENNPRKNASAVKYTAESIKTFGFKVPIIIDSDNIIVAGHTRIKAARRLKIKEVPCIRAADLTDEQIRAFRLADNKTAEMSSWDEALLADELNAIGFTLDMTLFGFEETDLEKRNEAKKLLSDKYIVPPFSVLNAAGGDWQKRKAAWKNLISSKEGREDALLGQGMKDLAEKLGMDLTGTSEFDPVLTEVLINWFCPYEGRIIDPFAGGSTRGIVSSYLGAKYTGIDLRQEQIDANMEDYRRNANLTNIFDEPLAQPNWITGDGLECQTLAPGAYDFLLTCPPYGDLETYSEDPRDISNMNYPDFKRTFTEIIKRSTEMLKQDTFAAIVVGEIRNKQGSYQNFVSDTIAAFEQAGLKYYNEIILVTTAGTLAVRVSRVFDVARKIGKTHQNVSIFCKGDPQSASRTIDGGTIITSKQVTATHEKVIVFTKGDPKKATQKLEPYDYVF